MSLIAALILPGVASAQYEASASYYTAVTDQTGTDLKATLKGIMTSGQRATSYSAAADYLAFTDANPSNLLQMFLVYDRTVVTKSSATRLGFTGAYASREHVWPDSRQNVSTANGDIHMLKPSDSGGGVNNQRSNYFYGGATLTGAARLATSSTFFAGDFDKGDVARISFYAATTYGPTLSLINGTTATPSSQQMGDLDSLLHWHYLDTPDTFELRRNDVIYRGDDVNTAGDDLTWTGTNNRNAYIDRPEYAWSVFKNQANDTKLSFGTASADGSSTANVDLGRVLRGASVPAAKTVTLSKSGVDGTYYSVTTGGSATSSVSGRYNAFAMDAAGSRSIAVGLNTTTTAAGLKSGTVTVDNLDVTTGGGAGRGANDGNDVANVTLSVLDVSNPSFAAGSDLNELTLDFGTVQQGATAAAQAFSIHNLASALGVDLTAGLDLDSFSGSGQTAAFSTNLAAFKTLLAGAAGRAFSATFDTSAPGTFSATYALGLSDEDLPGTQATSSLSLTLTGTVVAVPEPAAILLTTFVAGAMLSRRRRSA